MQTPLSAKGSMEAEIISTIKNIPKTLSGGGNALWTAAVKSSLITLGKKKGYRVCASGFPNECGPEWLYDLVWYRNEPSNHLREVPLVVESEWSYNPDHVKCDFEKLLVAKARVKVMIFQDFRGNWPQLSELLEAGIRSFQSEPANEKYILACYENQKDAFAIRTIPEQ
jgi:hypothetical protein